MLVKCKWCGIWFVQTLQESDCCSDRCEEAMKGLENEKESQNIFANLA